MSKKKEFLDSVKGLSVEDLKVQLEQSKQRLKKLEFAHAITPLENPMSIRSLRQDIARIQTLISQKTAVEQA
ncbi:50S ribosomal protein L29 [Niabella sp. CJ426]|jgi:large subunit ribosomal protein L29|uniref:Large ribosomal subunit protein uL29 n=1 Tax=Niabella yanshanensis TaxID=577386 RepID=A0ABZ0W609_9BACT|nr:50S ribosomal protein L29 [Niabella yanshanensis]MCH5684807.1 50S ribosomal protein L29 [Niabella sp. W65]MCH7363310.1 50S ribosomal protein L29 [Niabella sp. W65]WQD37947.1 50S ribosomal protein L29 [Niabella yanshanensis]HTG57761.1 50S ribosomal protein L29 [Niabella sp.]